MCINQDLCKNQLHLNLSLQTRACLRNWGAGWRLLISRDFKGFATTIMVNLTAPLAARLSPTLGKKADDLMVASRYGRFVQQHRWLLSSNKENQISRKNIQEKDVPFIERLPLSLNHLVSNGASSKGQKVCFCCVSFSFYCRCLYCRLAWTSWCPWLRAWGSLTKTRYFTTSQILYFYEDW